MNAFADTLLPIDAPMLDRLVHSLLLDVDMALLPDAFSDSSSSHVGEDGDCSGVEPSSEPYADEIPFEELAYWLGSPTDCVYSSCHGEHHGETHERTPQSAESAEHGHYVYIPMSRASGRLSAKIPVIALPRIEGVN